MNIIKYRMTYLVISAIIILGGILAMPINGMMGKSILNYDIEFAGGTSLLFNIGQDFNNDDIAKVVKDVTGQTAPQIQKVVGSNEVSVKLQTIQKEQRDKITAELKAKYPSSELLNTADISATISGEMQKAALLAIVIACIAMLIYISLRFKDIKIGSSAILALLHDVLIVFAVYSVFRVPVNNSFVAAILTILGFSINATIVIFDRVRENKKRMKRSEVEELINKSVSQTLRRSIFTSLTVIFTITALYILGVQSMKEFTFPLIIGVVCGTYSSVCVAGSLWYTFMMNASKKAN